MKFNGHILKVKGDPGVRLSSEKGKILDQASPKGIHNGYFVKGHKVGQN